MLHLQRTLQVSSCDKVTDMLTLQVILLYCEFPPLVNKVQALLL